MKFSVWRRLVVYLLVYLAATPLTPCSGAFGMNIAFQLVLPLAPACLLEETQCFNLLLYKCPPFWPSIESGLEKERICQNPQPFQRNLPSPNQAPPSLPPPNLSVTHHINALAPSDLSDRPETSRGTSLLHLEHKLSLHVFTGSLLVLWSTQLCFGWHLY